VYIDLAGKSQLAEKGGAERKGVPRCDPVAPMKEVESAVASFRLLHWMHYDAGLGEDERIPEAVRKLF